MEADKRGIRASLRGVRRMLPLAEVDRFSAAVCRHAQELPCFQQASSVGLYLAVDHEIDPSSLLLAAFLSKKVVFLPIVDRERHSLRFVQYRQGDPLVVGAFGIREPVLPTEKTLSGVVACATLSRIDVLFLPLVAFDRFGWRLGYGGGYYDRTLAQQGGFEGQADQKKPLLVGLAYAFQEVAVLPRAVHDVPMDLVVTDRGCLVVAGER